MNKKNNEPWRVKMRCPFCDELIIETTDLSNLPDDIDEDKREEILITVDYTGGHCEHLAFMSDWAYAGSFIEEAWSSRMRCIAIEFWKNEFTDRDYSKEENVNLEEAISSSLWNVFNGAKPSKEQLLELMQRTLKDVLIGIEGGFIEKYDGITSGGPTYMLIFLKNKL